MRWLWAAALVLCAAGCGPTTAVSTDTTVYADVYFSPDNGTRALFFIGRDSDGLDVFPRSLRPSALSLEPLTSPQQVRIYLAAAAARPFTLEVQGIGETAEVEEEAFVEVTPVLNDEVAVTVRLKKVGGETDAGVPDAGADGGMTDGGADAGVVCACATGCCLPGESACAQGLRADLAALRVLVQPCGPAGGVCQLGCDNYYGDGQCLPSGQCSGCGAGAGCGLLSGTRCVAGACRCDGVSNCAGCCRPPSAGGFSTQCQLARTNGLCGAGGRLCEACFNAGVGSTCDLFGRCGGGGTEARSCADECKEASQCCSGIGCKAAGYPSCRGSTGYCVTCDVFRTSACGGNGCVCGDTGGVCPASQRCLPDNQTKFRCVAVS